MVFDLEKASVALVLQGQTWCNMHPQYSRSLDPEQSHDILVQENHGNVADAQGKITQLVGGDGADIHVIRDDGTATPRHAVGPRRQRGLPGPPVLARAERLGDHQHRRRKRPTRPN